MASFTLFVLVALIAGGFAEPIGVAIPTPKSVTDPVQLARQKNLILLYFHINEPLYDKEQVEIAKTYKLQENVAKYSNVTAVKLAVNTIANKWNLPKTVPFSVLNPLHQMEAVTFFNVLFSAKDYETFYKTAVYFRSVVNEYVFAYVLSVAVYHRADTQGLFVPPFYEVFPSFFNNGEIMTTAHRIASHKTNNVEYYPGTYVHDDSVVIMWNNSFWPYITEDSHVSYYTHDFGLNTYYYNDHVAYPFWLGREACPLIKDKRGERFWFNHQQLTAHYYLERLSNNLGEIPVLGLDVVKTGYSSGLSYTNGIEFPVRPEYFSLQQPKFVNEIEDIIEYEGRIRNAIAKGFYITPTGEQVSLRNPEDIDVLGRLIEANVDSPNREYYKDFISVWKVLLGNSNINGQFYNGYVPLLKPSALELYQTTIRDPAFYMIWKRVLSLFSLWQSKLPHYKQEELALRDVTIKNVEISKLVTYFEHSYMNITQHTYLNEEEAKNVYDQKSILVQRPRMNHKDYTIKVTVNSETPKNVIVKFFLAPIYDSMGRKIPLQENYENFCLLDVFAYTLTAGENTIERKNTDKLHTSADFDYTADVYKRVVDAIDGKGPFVMDVKQRVDHFPQRLMLPKGRIGGMPVQVVVYISDYRAPNSVFGTGFDFSVSPGLGSGARRISSYPLGFPIDRPLYEWQIKGLKNIWFENVQIYHKPTPEMTLHYF